MERDTVGLDTGGLPEWINVPVLMALGDVQEAGAIELGLEWRPEGDDAGVLVASEPGSTSSAERRFLRDDATPANLAVGVADWLQAQVFPESAGAGGEARPTCPGHGHPMQAKVLYAVAWWVCPISDSPVRLIGER